MFTKKNPKTIKDKENKIFENIIISFCSAINENANNVTDAIPLAKPFKPSIKFQALDVIETPKIETKKAISGKDKRLFMIFKSTSFRVVLVKNISAEDAVIDKISLLTELRLLVISS